MFAHLQPLLAHRPFVRFWLARLSGITANQMLMVAVGWHMYDITQSPWDLGMVGLFQFVPALVMTLPAGQWVDRYHRARIFALCMLSQAAVALTLCWGVWTGQATRELILALSVVLGVARAFQMPAQQALTPLLVPRELLQKAIALSASGLEMAVIGGPALGGLLYALNATVVYVSCAMLLLVAFGLALSVKYWHVPAAMSKGWTDVFAGFQFVWRHKVLLGATSLDLFAVLFGGATALLPIYARDILNTGPIGLGFLRAAPAMGALVMTLVLTRWSIERQVGRRLLLAVAVFGLATVVFGLSESFALSMLALAATGAADSVSVVTRQTLMQLDTPDDMRGRVAAVNAIFIGASNQLGEFESGATAAVMGPVASVVFGGAASMAVAAGWFKLFPELAQRDAMQDAMQVPR